MDYGLLDRNGRLLGNPRCYRNAVDDDFLQAFEKVSHRELFSRTGIANLNFNTVYQLYRRLREGDVALQHAE